MSHVSGHYDADLHHDDGTHRTTCPSTSGAAIERYERRIADHLDDHRRKGEPTD